MVEFGAAAVGVNDGGEAAIVVVFIADDGDAQSVLHRGNVVWESSKVVVVLGRQVCASGAVNEFQDLEKVSGVPIVEVFDCRLNVES